MEKTFTFVVQIDADYETSEWELKTAVYRAIEYAKENDIEGAEALNKDVGQVQVN